MNRQLGRISGPLLKDNLLRDGVDLAFENELLYLDVNNKKIGIKSSAPLTDLFVNNFVRTTNLIVDNLLSPADITLQNNNISSIVGPLHIYADNVNFSRLGVGTIQIDDNVIYTMDSNADLELRPNGLGITKIDNNLWIDGSLHSTKNITADGSITFGTDYNDNVEFFADINSNIFPNIDGTYSIGNFPRTLRWNNTYAGLLNGAILTVEDSVLVGAVGGGIDISRRQGKIWYVAVYGSSGNVGDHPNGPFESIERAINNASYGDTIYVFPGTYYELFPLTVPPGVTITGADLRNTIVHPDTASEFEDVFLLNDASTVQNLTIKNFYFDSINNKGYAFRFAPGMNVTNRSPYVQNVTVITQGTVTSGSDPRGFDQGDAGKGAYIDGNVANILTNEATMLFHAVIFITPGVDAITMTNGVRVEFINSITYFANRGFYALQGTGRTTQDGSTKRYGAEVRSINSANNYGNYGVVADGANTLLYLIDHNFSYIGSGKSQENDVLLVNQLNEAVELNGGDIHVTSIDQRGTFRVGSNFFVDLDNGTTSIDITNISSSSIAGLNFQDNGNTTLIEPENISTGNINIHSNLIRSTSGEINITAANNTINLNTNINVARNLDINKNLNIDGTLTFGNQIADTIIFYADIDDNLDPKIGATHDIGSPTRNWKELYTRKAYISDVEIFTNYIKTNISNADLELRTNGNGTVLVEDIRVQERTISTDTTNIRIEPATTLDITASTSNVNGDFHVTNDVYFDSDITFGDDVLDTVTFNANVDSDIIPQQNERWELGDPIRSWNLYVGNILLDELEINDNYIRTTASNLNLELRANGTGLIQFEQTYIDNNRIYTVGSNNLKIEPATTLDITALTTNVNGNFHVTNNVYFDSDIIFGNQFSDDIIVWSSVNSNIEPQITANYELGDSIRSWNLYTGKILLDELEINDNYIYTKTSNLNLELRANGVGSVQLEKTYFNENLIYTVGTNLKIEPATTLDITASTSNVNGNFHVTNNVYFDSDVTFGNQFSDDIIVWSSINSNIEPQITANYELGDTERSWNLYTGKILLDEIEINDNYIYTRDSNLNLELKANGTGSVLFEQTYFNENLIYTVGTNLKIEPATTLDITASTTTVNGDFHLTQNTELDSNITFGFSNLSTIRFFADTDTDIIPQINDVYALGNSVLGWNLHVNKILLDDIEINDNYIVTNASNLNLELKANGVGAVRLEQVDINENIILTNGATNLVLDPATTLDITKTTNITGSVNVTGDFDWQGTITFGNATTDDVVFVSDINSDIIPDLPVTYNLGSAQKRWKTTWLENSFISDIEINTNVIRTTISNANLEFYGNAVGGVRTEDLRFRNNTIEGAINNQNVQISLTGTSILDINTNTALRTARGTTADRPIPTMSFGDMRFNTSDNLFGGFTTARVTFGGVYSADRLTFARVEPISNVITFSSQGTTAAYIDTSKVWLNGLNVDNFTVQNNTWATNNIDFLIDPDANNIVDIEGTRLNDNVITNNVTDQSITLAHTDKGFLEIKGTLGFKMPAGPASQRPLTPDNGTARWSTEEEYLEMYINGAWGVATGGGSGYASQEEVEEINLFYTLILG